MKTFDISVNLLNNNVLSDKLLWKDRPPAVTRIAEKPPETALQQPVAPNAYNCRSPEIPLEMSLLTLPMTFVVALIILFQTSHTLLTTTLVACALIVGTPAVLIVWQQRTCVQKHMYVHILLLHEAALLIILHPRALFYVFVVFVIVFADLSLREKGKRRVFYFFMAIVNAATLYFVMQQDTQLQSDTHFNVDNLCACVILLSTIVYVTSTYI